MARFDLPLSEESRKKRFLLRWQFYAILLVLMVIVGAVLYFSSGRQYVRSWRAKSQLELAEDLAGSEEWEAVFSHASQSVKLAPSLEGLRLVAKSGYKTGRKETLVAAWRLFQFQGASLKDRAWALKLAFDFVDLKTAKAMSERLSSEERLYAPIRFQLIRGSLLTGKFGEALALASQEPVMEDGELDLLLVVSLAKSGLREARSETISRLRKVINCESRNLALEGLEILASLSNEWLEMTLAREAIARFGDDAELSAFHDLHLKTLQIRLRLSPLNETVDEAISQYRENDAEVLVRWLLRIRQYNKVLQVTADPDVQKLGNIFLIRLDVLAKTGDWSGLQNELESAPVNVPAPIDLALHALVLRKLDQEPRSIVIWRKAFEAARNDKKKNWFSQLAQIAELMEYKEGQMESLISAIGRRDWTPPSAKSLTPVFAYLVGKDDQERILSLSENLLLRESENPVLLNNFLYLKSVYRKTNQKDLKTMENLIMRFPNQPNFRHTLAMIQLRLDKYRGVIETMRSIPVTISESHDTERAIRAQALFKLGNEEEARDLAATVDYDDFSAKELEILKLPAPVEEEEGE